MDLKKFYGSLIVFYFSDMALLIMVIWLSYQITKNPLLLGTMLFISIVIPFILKKLSKINLLSLNISNLMFVRIFLYLMAFILAILPPSLYGFIGLALISGVLGISILSNYESYNNYLVVHKMIDAAKASKYMQTVIQIGAFSGAMIGGALLNYLSFTGAMGAVVVLDIAFALICLFWAKTGVFCQIQHTAKNDSKPIQADEIFDKKSLYLLCSILGFIGIHIISFNLTTPILFQEIKQWSVQDFGLSSAFAGVGAFLAVFIKSNKNRCAMMAIALVVMDLIFVFLQIKAIAFLACFFIGMCINAIRIFIRQKLSLLAKTPSQASYIGQSSAVYYTLFQACASLLFGYILANMSDVSYTKAFLPAIAFVIALLYITITLKYKTAH